MPKSKQIKNCKTVAELLANPERWTRHCFARNKQGFPVLVHSSEASCFCLTGGLSKIYSNSPREEREAAIQRVFASLQKLFVCSSIVVFNDRHTTTHKDILKLVKDAKI